MITFPLPKDFLFGSASSAFQIEGSPYADGKSETIWDYMCRVTPERFDKNAKTEPASSFYKNFRQDIADMKELGLKSFRLSLCWARIIPGADGKVNQKGIDFYDQVIDLLLESGIEPFVDLYHWDMPMWVEEQGGLLNRGFLELFTDYAKVCFEAFGDRVKYWSTFNEPGVFCFQPYANGEKGWYPYGDSFADGLLATHHVLLAHFRTVKLYRAMGMKGKIGAVIDKSATYPLDPHGKDLLAAQYQTDRGIGWWLDPMFLGHYPETILRDCPAYREAMPPNYEEEIRREFEKMDMVGINYYYPGITSYREDLPEKSTKVSSFIAQTNQRFSSYPAGLYDAMMYLTEHYDRPEIYVTENGLGILDEGDYEKNIKDDYRVDYIREHLRMLSRCIKAGANVKGYYYWSHFDSLESRSGYRWRFGLTYVDFPTGKREKKNSWYYYQKIIKNGSVD